MPTEKPPEFKFPMHNVHLNQSIRNLKMACIYSLVASTLLYMFNNAPRQRKYKTFYSSYDPIDAFDRMMSGGYMDSFPPGSGPKKSKKDKKKK